MKHNRIIAIVSIIGLAALILIFNFTSPTEIGPFGVLLFFTTLYISSFGIFALLLQLYRRLALKRNDIRNKDYLYAAVLAFTPIILLIARSFGAINLWTISLVCIFLLLAEFLVAKRA